MTPESFEIQMREILKHNAGDPESAHYEADQLICDLLRSLGYGKGVAIFENMPKWYA